MLDYLRQIWKRFYAAFFRHRKQNSFTGVTLIAPRTDDKQPIKARNLVLVGTSEKKKWIRFQCPCGCGEVLALNLMKSQYPCWTIEEHDDKTVSVHPSVDAQKCGAHFWIRHNRIDWC